MTDTSSTGSVNEDTITRMHPSMKRPRASIACYRCHHKKVRCDGVHPNCTRCLTTGVLCAYPSSRRSRNTQPTNVDPFIDNLSQLEAKIRQIETDLELQRTTVHSVLMGEKISDGRTASDLTSQLLKSEQEVQESRSILAQLRLRGEQRISRSKRAAAAAAAAASSSSSPAIVASNQNQKSSASKRLLRQQRSREKNFATSLGHRSNPSKGDLRQNNHSSSATSLPSSSGPATVPVTSGCADVFYYPSHHTDSFSLPVEWTLQPTNMFFPDPMTHGIAPSLMSNNAAEMTLPDHSSLLMSASSSNTSVSTTPPSSSCSSLPPSSTCTMFGMPNFAVMNDMLSMESQGIHSMANQHTVWNC